MLPVAVGSCTTTHYTRQACTRVARTERYVLPALEVLRPPLGYLFQTCGCEKPDLVMRHATIPTVEHYVGAKVSEDNGIAGSLIHGERAGFFFFVVALRRGSWSFPTCVRVHGHAM